MGWLELPASVITGCRETVIRDGNWFLDLVTFAQSMCLNISGPRNGEIRNSESGTASRLSDLLGFSCQLIAPWRTP
jgi:hypothetical protein